MLAALILIAFVIGVAWGFEVHDLMRRKPLSDQQLAEELHKWQMSRKYHGYTMFDVVKHFYYRGRRLL